MILKRGYTRMLEKIQEKQGLKDISDTIHFCIEYTYKELFGEPFEKDEKSKIDLKEILSLARAESQKEQKGRWGERDGGL